MKFQKNKIYLQDCIGAMNHFEDKSVDLIIADPPYNLSKGNKLSWENEVKRMGFGGKWIKTMEEWDNMPLLKYFEFTLSWLFQVKRVLKPSGSFWIFGTYHNIGIINFALQLLEIEILNEIIWYKRNSFPNLRARRFTASHETILWGHTGKKREYYFDYDFTKDHKFPEDNLKKTGKQMRTVWDIPNNKKKEEYIFGKHPTQKPIRILERMIISSSKKNSLVLVPFAGVGSECISCIKNNRNYMGFEINSNYYEIAKKRIDKYERDFWSNE